MIQLPFNFSPVLETEANLDFVADQGQTTIRGPEPTRPGYLPLETREAGSFEEVEWLDQKTGKLSKRRLSLFWSVHERYTVFERARKRVASIGDIDVIVPQEQPLRLTVLAYLLVGEHDVDPADKNTIVDLFRAYDPRKHKTVDEYVQSLGQTYGHLPFNRIAIAYGYKLDKVGQSQDRHEVRDAILGAYEGKLRGEVFPRPTDQGDGQPPPSNRIPLDGAEPYFPQHREISVALIPPSVPLRRSPEWPAPGSHSREAKKGAELDAAQAVAQDDLHALDCGGTFRKHDYLIAKLFEYPEFRKVLRDYRYVLYRDDCGNEVAITVTLPVLQKRTSEISLLAYMRYPDTSQDVTDLVHDVLEECLLQAALASAVIGVALSNFAAALAAFKGIFVECVKFHWKRTLDCMVPGLALITAPEDDWTDWLVL